MPADLAPRPTSAAAPFDHLLIAHASAASEAGAAALKVVKLPNLAALLARLQHWQTPRPRRTPTNTA